MTWTTARITLILAAAIGTLDVAEFLLRRLSLFKENPKRAGGTLALLVAWLILLVSAFAPTSDAQIFDMALSASLLCAGILLMVVHIRHHLLSWRMFVGPVAAMVALVASVIGS